MKDIEEYLRDMKIDINAVFHGLGWLAEQEDNHNAGIAFNALGALPATLFSSIQPILIDFADFCEGIEVDEDDLTNAMEECKR